MMKIFDYTTGKITQEVNVTPNKLTCMIVDESSKFGILADGVGTLHVFDLNSVSLTLFFYDC